MRLYRRWRGRASRRGANAASAVPSPASTIPFANRGIRKKTTPTTIAIATRAIVIA
jgi:hypothetical protein